MPTLPVIVMVTKDVINWPKWYQWGHRMIGRQKVEQKMSCTLSFFIFFLVKEIDELAIREYMAH